MKVKKINEPIYKLNLLFVTDCSRVEADKVIKRYGFEEMGESFDISTGTQGHGYSSKMAGRVFFIWIKSKKDFYVLLHEVTHLVQDIFEEKGIPINKETTEVFAYYQEFWFKTLWRVMNKKA